MHALLKSVGGPKSGSEGCRGPKNNRLSGGTPRDLARTLRNQQAALPPTAMRDAFLRALVRWAKRRPNTDAWIAIPTGTVTAGELARVVCALGLVDREGRP